MLNEVQKNIRIGKMVHMGLLLSALCGLLLVVIGVRSITKDLPRMDDDIGTPKLTPAPRVSIGSSAAVDKKKAPPKKVYFYVDGVEIEGIIEASEDDVEDVNDVANISNEDDLGIGSQGVAGSRFGDSSGGIKLSQ